MHLLLVGSGLLSCITVSGSLLLQHNLTASTCPGDVVSCECSGARSLLSWIVLLDGQVVWRRITYDIDDVPGPESRRQGIPCTDRTCAGGETIVGESELLSVDVGSSTLTSVLNISLSRNLSVRCESTDEVKTTMFHDTGSPLPPQNLNFTLTSIAERVKLRLEWDPPVNDGSFLSYQVFLNASEVLSINSSVANSSVATIEINSTGQHLIEIRAINCAGISPNATLVINTTGTCELPTLLPIGIRLLPMEGNQLLFECGEGLLPQGRVVADCLPDGTWRPRPQNHICITDCGVPSLPVNGRIENYESTAEGANLTFHCDKGFSPCGEITSVCTRNGWKPLPQSTNCTLNTTVDSGTVWSLSTAAISGIVVSAVVGGVVLYTCGILTGILITWWRRRTSKSSSSCVGHGVLASGDPGVSVQVVYEEVLPSKPAAKIPMQENVSYGPLQ